MNTPKVILDVRGTLMHAYYSGKDPNAITLDDGKRINTAAFGFQLWLERYFNALTQRTRPINLIAAFDGGNEYRRAIFRGYKAARDEAKEKRSKEEQQQLDLLEESAKVFLANMGAICIQAKGVEADDVIAAVCKGLHDTKKMIHTIDADLLQLSDENTLVYLKEEPIVGVYRRSENGVKLEIPLNLIVLSKALMGDSSDGYGGVKGFGPKAWLHLESKYGLDGLMEIDECFRSGNMKPLEEAVEASKDKVLDMVWEQLPAARMCYTLAKLAPHCCYQFQGNSLIWPKYYVRVPNRTKVLTVLHRMNCPEALDRYEHLFPKFYLLTEENKDELIELFLDNVEKTPFFAFDYETVDVLKHQPFNEAMSAQSKSKGNYVDVLSSKLTGSSFCFGESLEHVIYISVNHRNTMNVPKSLVVDFIETVEGTGKPLVAHNASFEEQVTKLDLGHQLVLPYDTMIMSSYVDENEESHLKGLSKSWLNYDQVTYKDTLQAAGAADMSELTGPQVLQYGCDDSLVTAHLFRVFELICRMEGVWSFYEENERAPMHLLNEGFESGVRIDFDRMEVLAEKGQKIIDEGFAFLRAELTERCKEMNKEVGNVLDEADGDNLEALDKAVVGKDGAKRYSKDALLARREKRKLDWAEASIYRPYIETRVMPEFIGTHTQLNFILRQLGVTDLELTSIARNGINELLTELRHNFNTAQFCELLGPAVSELKARKGPAFEALKAYCTPFLGEGKIEKSGDELNLNSPDQMQELLYCKLALPVRRRTKVQRDSNRYDLGLQGSPGTDEKAMKLAIAEDCSGENEWKRKVLETVIDVKEQQTLFSLYFNTYPLWVHPRDGAIHPAVRNCGTVTRRPTGSNPNVLQVKKGEMREIYLPRYDDHIILDLDFNGQELRITGSEAKDPVLIDCYTGGGFYTDEDGMIHPVVKDVHSVTSVSFAREIFAQEGLRELLKEFEEIDYDLFRQMLKGKISPEAAKAAALVRKYAKTVNFLIIYGGSASTLAMGLGMPTSFAEQVMRLVFARYARLAPWQEETISFAYRHGYVKTAYGTLKHLNSEIRSKDGGLRSRQERQAVNSTIQGCAADILKVVMTGCYETRLFQETGAKLIAPVYDSIVASVPLKSAYEYVCRLQDQMNVTPPGHAIPMLAEVSVGPTWGKCAELGDHPSEKKFAAAVDEFWAKTRKAA